MSPRFPFPAYPNGWFAIGFSSDFARGEVVTRRAFGQEIVVHRTEGGALAASDPFCPHLGAHLGHGGRVVGEKLRCPFHGWCFDAAGRCVEVPGASVVPRRAELRRWPIAERNGVVLAYHDARGGEPAWQVPELPTDGWSEDRTVIWTVRTHPQDVFENVVDRAHLGPVHGAETCTIVRAPRAREHSFDIALNLVADGAVVGMPGVANDVVLDVTMHGLGQAFVHTEVRNVGIHARQRIYCTPIDEERTEIRGVVAVRDLGQPFATDLVAEIFYRAYVSDFALDFPIWENKAYHDRPILSSADGPFMLYRRWARQFYPSSSLPVLATPEPEIAAGATAAE
jgi:nitrite reductase/ring-hydroxylating ferredoxin subunit